MANFNHVVSDHYVQVATRVLALRGKRFVLPENFANVRGRALSMGAQRHEIREHTEIAQHMKRNWTRWGCCGAARGAGAAAARK